MNETLKIGNHVVYAVNGICKIEEIKAVSIGKETAQYYILKPLNHPSSSIMVPMANETLTAKLRPTLSKQEIDDILNDIKDAEFEWISERSERNTCFKKIIAKADEKELLLLARCIFLKEGEFTKIGKKLPAADYMALKNIEQMIREEFSFSLEIPQENVDGYIKSKIGLS